MDALSARYSDTVSSVVLFGSMARGDFGRGSDFDVLVVLRRSERERFLDRLAAFADLTSGGVDVFPYTLDEIASMESGYHLTLIEALDHGIPLLDDGTFAAARERHMARKAAGALERIPVGWRIHPERDPFSSVVLASNQGGTGSQQARR